MSRIRKSVSNLTTSVLLNLATILASFFSIPIILHALGANNFGLIRTLFEWIGIIAVVSGAYFSFSTQNLARVKGDRSKLRLELKKHIQLGCGIVLFILPLIGLFLWFSPILVKAPAELFGDVRWGALYGALGLLFIPLLTFQALIEAENQGYWVNTLLLSQRLFMVAMSVLLAIYFPTIQGQFIPILLAQAVFFWAVIKKADSSISFSLSSFSLPSLAQVRGSWKSLSSFAKIEAAGKIGMTADILLISFFMGPSNVTKYFLWVRLPILIQGQLQSLGNSVWAGFAELFNKGAEVSGLFLHLAKGIGLLSVACTGVVFLLNKDFLLLWIGPGQEISLLFGVLVGLNMFSISMISFFGWILTATHGEAEFSNASIYSSIVNLLVGLVMTNYAGLYGPLFGSLVGYGLIKIVWVLKGLSTRLRLSFLELFLAVGLPPILGVVYFSGIFLARGLWQSWAATWLGLGALGIVQGFSFLILGWATIFSSEEQKFWISRIRTMIGSRA